MTRGETFSPGGIRETSEAAEKLSEDAATPRVETECWVADGSEVILDLDLGPTPSPAELPNSESESVPSTPQVLTRSLRSVLGHQSILTSVTPTPYNYRETNRQQTWQCEGSRGPRTPKGLARGLPLALPCPSCLSTPRSHREPLTVQRGKPCPLPAHPP